MRNFLIRLWRVLIVVKLIGFSAPIFACQLGTVLTEDKSLSATVTQAAAGCAGAESAVPAHFISSEAISLDIKLTSSANEKNDAVATITQVTLLYPDGKTTSTEPRVRSMGKDSFFADNIEFPVPGTWNIVMTLERGEKKESLKIAVPVAPNNKAVATVKARVPVSNFSFTDARGQTVGKKDLLGKVWVLDLMFTSCPAICPLMSQKMAALQKEFQAEQDFRLVSVSTDPEIDTPQVLEKYATSFKADLDRWFFLTGKKATVVKLSSKGMNLGASLTGPMHSTHFAVIDRDGKIKGTFDSEKRNELERLKKVVKELLAEKGNSSPI